ncbi:MAG: hypothetical protein DCC71_00925 [Proteobacteria bacterium]|nr:MAG: hypothetical protein DCC71_00925 [Pseudomonadota bacterium]
MRIPYLIAASLVVASPIAAWAHPDNGSGRYYVEIHTANSNYHDPNDLKAYADPGPGPAVDGEGDQLDTDGPRPPGLVSSPGRIEGIEPGRPLDAALLSDPSIVKWPTLDKSLWEKHKGSYQIVPR